LNLQILIYDSAMLSLVYASSAVHLFSENELVTLLNQSREKNTRLELSGMLLYKDGNFLQVLEGPEEAVQSLFKAICADDRHRGVLRLFGERIEARRFPDWAMAFRNLNSSNYQNLPGYSAFMNEPLDPEKFRVNPSGAKRLLEVFRETM
jgi:Sensors of blue-light using FAD